MKHKGMQKNKEIFIYGIKQIKTGKVGIFLSIGCDSDEVYENDKPFNFWFYKIINKEIEMRNFKITGCFF